MKDPVDNNRRLAKNTVVLFLRMLVMVLISLYTSRVLLRTLGVNDYGIFNIVGGVVVMLGFLNSSMSGATSRFLSFALVKSSKEYNDTFSTAVIIHMVVALAVLVLSETVGLWLVLNKLAIPDGRQTAAFAVYQCCVASFIVSVMRTPPSACIISHERMTAYAVLEITDTVLKLCAVLILSVQPYDRLIVYGLLYFAVSLVVCASYWVYCRIQFHSLEVHFRCDSGILKPMLQFCGWDLYGNLAIAAKQQGTNIIINIFFGVALNAASAIATQVQTAVSGFAANVLQAVRPQIIKSYATGDIKAMEGHICNTIKYMLVLYGLMFVPLYIELEPVLHLWLGDVPEYSASFCRILLITSMVSLVCMVLITGIHATGHIGVMSFCSGTVNLLALPVIYMVLRYMGPIPEYAYVILLLACGLRVIINLVIIRNNIREIGIRRIILNIFKPVLAIALAFTAAWFCRNISGNAVADFCIVLLVSWIVLSLTFCLLLMNRDQVEYMKCFGLLCTLRLRIIPRILSAVKHEDANIIARAHLKAFINKAVSPVIEKYKDATTSVNSVIPEDCPIWVCWWQGEECLPEIPSYCLETIRKFSAPHPVIFVSKDNYRDYTDLPVAVLERFEKGDMSVTHLADVLRVNLLKEHGGIWLDSSMWMLGPLNVEQTVFYTKRKRQGNAACIADNRWTVGVLGGAKNLVLFSFLCDCYECYWTRYRRPVDYLLMDDFIDAGYDAVPAIRRIIDEAPYTNPDFYDLKHRLDDACDEEHLLWLSGRNSLLSLNRRDKVRDYDDDGNLTYFGYLKKTAMTE